MLQMERNCLKKKSEDWAEEEQSNGQAQDSFGTISAQTRITTSMEVNAFSDPELEPDPTKPKRWINVVLPILVITFGTLISMLVIGAQRLHEYNPNSGYSFQEIISHTDSSRALLWASLSGTVVIILLVTTQRILTFNEAFNVWLKGVQNMTIILLTLVFAWALGGVCRDLQTAQYAIQLLGTRLPPGLLPVLVFLVCAITSFSTGTSWGTMGIMFPLVVPLAHAMQPGDEGFMVSTIASILSGSVWGDHWYIVIYLLVANLSCLVLPSLTLPLLPVSAHNVLYETTQ